MTNICNFCLKLSNGCNSVDKKLKETIELLFNNVEFVIADCSQICKECIQSVHSAFDLKAASICHEDLIVSYKSNKPRHEKLFEVYLEKNKIKCDIFPKDFKICIICISVLAENNFNLLKDIEVNSIVGETISTHFCEIDFSITNNPIVCKECLKKLQAYGMFINSWLYIYNLKKNYCHINEKIDTFDLNEVRKFIFEIKIDSQHSDIYKINTKKEIFTMKEFDNEDKKSEENKDFIVENIQVKDDIEIEEWQYPVEEMNLETESVFCDSHVKSELLSMNDNLKIEESKQETETLNFETKMELCDYILKEEEIFINDATNTEDSTQLLSNLNQRIKEQKSNENSLAKHEVAPIEANTSGTLNLRFLTESPLKVKEKDLNLKKSVKQLWPSKNCPYQQIEVNYGFRCGFCPFQNQLEASVEEHFKNCHCPNYNCLNLGETAHKKISSEIYRCEHCVYKSINKRNLKRHSKVHSNDSKILKCELCVYQTTKKRNLKRHSKVHSNDSKVLKCEHCDFKTKYKKSLNLHLVVHSNESEIHKCGHCDYKTIYKTYLRRHLVVHSTESKIYECEHCDYKTKYKFYFKSHLMVHSTEYNNFKCEHCDFKTKYKSSLKSHLMMHSNESEIHKCGQCDYKTKYKIYLKKHLIVHSSVSKMYECKYCDYKAKCKVYLKSHLRVHSNESKIFKCEHCVFKTKYKNNLKSHLMLHTNKSEIHKCGHCGYQSLHKHPFKKHLRKHSNDSKLKNPER